MGEKGAAESLIEDKLGCGTFQVLIVIFLFVFIKFPSLTTFVFMSYGNFNPGWRCLDNVTLDSNTTGLDSFNGLYSNNSTVAVYKSDHSCAAFQACQQVEFNPDSSTIVTEWNLICDKAYIPAFIISLQMAGNLVGSTVSGQLADTIGRKKTLYGSLLITAVLTFVSIFSTSWQMFGAFRFVIGLLSAFFEALNYIYPAEFLTKKWRGPLAGIPGWSTAGVLFGVTVMLLKDWRHVLVAISAACIVGCIPAIWVPESLRWLEVKDKKEEFRKLAKRMAKLNGVMEGKMREEDFALHEVAGTQIIVSKVDTKKYTILDLFHPGYKRYSIIIGFVWISMSHMFYAISFGVKAFHGDFYVNLILIYTLLVPCCVFPTFAPNMIGRRLSSCVFISIAALCLFSATLFDKFSDGKWQLIGTLVFVMVAEVGVDTTWSVQQVHLTEIYPTVVRGIAINGASLMGRIGGIIAPFMVPNDPEMLYVWFLIMGCMGVVTSGLISRLPETKGKPMKETFEDNMDTEIITNVA